MTTRFDERIALFIAIGVSAGSISATFGLAAFLRQPRSSYSQPQPVMARATSAELTPDVFGGKHLFLMNCAHCHGDDAHGDEGPDLYNLHKSDARIHQVIVSGIKGEMPSFAKKLGDSEIKQLTAYLRTLKT